MIERVAVFIALAVALSACSRLGGSSALPSNASGGASVARGAAAFKTIFTFNGSDGSSPSGTLIASHGVLYGVTAVGGTHGRGTVFSLTRAGSEKVLHDFSTDGAFPSGSLIDVRGILYGTTEQGGKRGNGTIFALRTDGSLAWTYDFKGGWDGAAPRGGLTYLNGALYGVTASGGDYYEYAGAFFKVSLSGKEIELRAFSGGPDGRNPNGNLAPLKGDLYGTTYLGGPTSDVFGTVIRLTTSGAETELHHFAAYNDGQLPLAGLVYLNGTFYGTTQSGGTSYAGTVFSITPSGKERVIHSFGSGSDGIYPVSRLVVYSGNLYGTTPRGGTHDDGTIFEVSPSGAERVLYNFTGGSDGSNPMTGLLALDGVLYGTTSSPPSSNDDGTVFALTP